VLISPTTYFVVAYVKPTRLFEANIVVDPSPQLGMQAGWAGVQTWLAPVNFVQCGWLDMDGMFPTTFCQIWVNGSPVDTIIGTPLQQGSIVSVSLSYYSNQWVLWTQAQGQPWTVEWVGTNAATPTNSQYEVVSESLRPWLPAPLKYSLG
jgi:hypothetical protein